MEQRNNNDQNTDMVNKPPHYTFGKYEVIDILESWNLPFHLANSVKYVARSGKKWEDIEDLKKALWYLNRYINWKNKPNYKVPAKAINVKCVLEDWKLSSILSYIIEMIYNGEYKIAAQTLNNHINILTSEER